jgi:hypothetical protein
MTGLELSKKERNCGTPAWLGMGSNFSKHGSQNDVVHATTEMDFRNDSLAERFGAVAMSYLDWKCPPEKI